MRMLVRRLVLEEDGQDLVEYALLAAFVGLATAATLNAIEISLGEAYTRWDTNTQKCWTMPDPGAASCK